HPTLAAAAGATADGDLDGIDLQPRLSGGSSAGGADRALHWECGFQWAVRDGDWKLAWTDPDSPKAAALRRQERAPVGEGWHLADLSTDPGERTNRYDDEPAVVTRLLDRHTTWRTEVGLTRPRP